MQSEKEQELLDLIFKLFPKASIVSRSEFPHHAFNHCRTNIYSGVAKLSKPPRPVLRACKKSRLDSPQLSFPFHKTTGGAT